ncbi:MAG: RluA family pseudouridine synthase [Alphaproteobacteria bacterium]|nr:RluA family pseudouridine synthase [Alphaproteobacteria bacterium]
MREFVFEVTLEEVGVRIDKFVSNRFATIRPEITRSQIKILMQQGCLQDKDGQPITSGAQSTKFCGQIFKFILPDPKPSQLKPKKIKFEIIHEDDDLLVINKPDGLTVHPGSGNHDNTLVNGLLFTHADKLSSLNGEMRPGIVHRLDKDTSGLMLVAKNDFTHQALSNDLKNRNIKRSYLAFIYGVCEPRAGRIEKNIGRSPVNRLKMKITKNGRVAITNYETKKIFCDGYASLVECRLETGRTHQIRVHMEAIKHSLIGDQLYNSCRKNAVNSVATQVKKMVEDFPRQALHSYKIGFSHPCSGKEMSFEISLPDDLLKLQKCLEEF